MQKIINNKKIKKILACFLVIGLLLSYQPSEMFTYADDTIGESSDEYNDAELADLEVIGADYIVPKFDPGINTYRACGRTLKIKATLESEFASLEVDGNQVNNGEEVTVEFGEANLKDVTIEVTASDGVTKNIYNIAVTKLSSYTNSILLKEDFNDVLNPANGINNYIVFNDNDDKDDIYTIKDDVYIIRDDIYIIDSLTENEFELKSTKEESDVKTIAMNDIAFICSAVNGKEINDDSVGSGSMKQMSSYDYYTDWKLSRYNDCNDFAVDKEYAVISAGESFEFHYENAEVGENNYISALLVNDSSSRKKIYYGRLKAVNSDADKNGTASISFPKAFSGGEFTLYVFSEEYNGDWTSDSVSNMVEIPLKVDKLSSAAGLLPMEITGCTLTPAFEGGSSKYYVSYGEVSHDTETITFTLTSIEPNVTIQVNGESVPNGQPYEYSLNSGYNQFDIKSRAENGQGTASFHIGIRRLADEEEESAICLDASPLKGYSDSGYRKILFSNWDDESISGKNPKPVEWRILDTTSNDENTEALFLLREELLVKDPANAWQGVPYGDTNDWETSSIRDWLNNEYFNNTFSEEEKAVVLETTKTETEKVSGSKNLYTPSNLDNDKLFCLSALEAKNSVYGFDEDVTKQDFQRRIGGYYYLRSGVEEHATSSAVVVSSGYMSTWSLAWAAARPAMNIDSSKIAFTSAVNTKDNADGVFVEVPKIKGNREWVLTLKSDVQDFAVTEETFNGTPGSNVEFQYENAETGDNQYISALILDAEDNVKYYSRLFKAAEANGTGSFSVPLIDENTYKILIFNEQYNGSGKTSAASNFDEAEISVGKLNGLLVRFETNGGVPIPKTIVAKGGHTIAEPEETKKAGYSFMGWYADKELTTPWDFSKDKIWDNTVLYARWEAVDLHADAPGTYEASVSLEMLGVSKACMVIAEDGIPEHTVSAPYDNGKITIEVPAAGDYSFTAGKAIEEMTQTGKLSHDKIIDNSYKGTGEVGNPYHTIVNFLNKKNGGFGLMWYIPTTWAGYETDGASESSTEYNAELVKSVVFEARDFNTGKILGTMTMDGSRRKRVPIGRKFPFPMSLTLEPDKDDIENWVENNELYNYENSVEGYGISKDRADHLIAEAQNALDSNDEILIVHESRRENFGPYTMKLEVEDSFGFASDKHVKVVYLGGTGGGDYQGGTEPAPSLEDRLKNEFSWNQYYEKNLVVDQDGYVTFDLYNSGMFKLVKTNEDATPEYTVTFNSNGGSFVMAERVAQYASLEKPEDPTKPGYHFAGWYEDEKFTNTWDFETYKVTKDLTLYAKWNQTAASFTVKFDVEGIEDQTVANGGKVLKPENPEKENKIFAGWYSDAALTKLWDFENDVVTEELNLYAEFMDVAYQNLQEGKNQLSADLTGYSGACLVMLTNGTDRINIITVNGKINVNIPTPGDYAVRIIDTVENLTLTGKSEPLENAYKGNGTEENPYVILANIANVPVGTMFGLKWATPANWAGYAGGGANNETSEVYEKSLTKNVVFETRDYNTGRLIASGNLNGKVLPDDPKARQRIPVAYKCPFNMNFRINPTEQQIDSWLENNSLYNFDGAVEGYQTAAKRVELLKQKALNILSNNEQALLMFENGREFFGPVNFEIDVQNYGYQAGDKIYIKYLGGTGGGEYHHTTPPIAERLANEFAWSINNTKSAVADENGYIKISLYNGGMYRLSKTEDNTCIVAFNSNGGSAIAAKEITIGTKIEKPDNPTKDGYTFKGWFSNSELTESFDFEKEINTDTVIYAKWSKDGGSSGGTTETTYTVEFITGKTSSGDAAATIPSQEVEEGKKATDPAKDSSTCPFGFYDRGDGYLVLDWYTDEKLKNKFRFSTAIKENIKLYPEYQRYILKDDGDTDGGKGTKSNPYKVKLGDTKQSKIAWKFFNELAKGTFKGYYKVYAEKKNDGDELFSWTFNGDDFSTCDTAQPYYIYITTEKVGNTLELEMVNRTAIEGKVTISVDISKYIKDGEVEVEYKSGSCDGKVAHSNVESGNWVQSHHKPKSYFTDTTATVKKGYVTFDITHGGTYIIKSDQIKADDDSSGGSSGSKKAVEKETIKAGEKIDAAKLKSILDEGKHLFIKSDNGTALFDTKAIKALQEKNKGNIEISIDSVENEKLSEKQKKLAGDKVSERPIYNLTAKSGSQKITTFGKGKVTVTLPYTLKGTEQSLGVVIWYLNDKGELADIPCDYDAEKKEVTFTTNHFSYYVVGYDKNLEWVNPFSDVKETDWFFKAVANINKSGFMSGVTKTEFKPNANTTRAMLVTILYRMEGSPEAGNPVTFKDVAKTSWYTDAVCWAVKNEIVNGYDELTFGTNDAITREQLVSILYRYKKMKEADLTAAGTVEEFEDANQISSWAADSVKWAIGANILTGKGNGSLDPKGNATRAEVAAVIERIK